METQSARPPSPSRLANQMGRQRTARTIGVPLDLNRWIPLKESVLVPEYTKLTPVTHTGPRGCNENKGQRYAHAIYRQPMWLQPPDAFLGGCQACQHRRRWRIKAGDLRAKATLSPVDPRPRNLTRNGLRKRKDRRDGDLANGSPKSSQSLCVCV